MTLTGLLGTCLCGKDRHPGTTIPHELHEEMHQDRPHSTSRGHERPVHEGDIDFWDLTRSYKRTVLGQKSEQKVPKSTLKS